MAKVNNTNSNTQISRNSSTNTNSVAQERFLAADLSVSSETTLGATQTRTLQTNQTNVSFGADSSRGSTSSTQSPGIPDQEDIVLTTNCFNVLRIHSSEAILRWTNFERIINSKQIEETM